MITLFRRMREKLIQSGSLSKYLIYALGEILLVVIGILIALQVNNWNEVRKMAAFEISMLEQLDASLTSDSSLIATFLMPDLDQKEKAIDSLKYIMGNKIALSSADFMDLYNDARNRVSFRVNVGPYETIKSNGLSLISNVDLRDRITRNYEVTFPTFQSFFNELAEKNSPIIDELEFNFLKIDLIKDENGGWYLYDTPSVSEVLTHPSFRRALYLEIEIADNYRRQLRRITGIQSSLHNRIREELSGRINHE